MDVLLVTALVTRRHDADDCSHGLEDPGTEVRRPVMRHLQDLGRKGDVVVPRPLEERLLRLLVQVCTKEQSYVAVRQAEHDRVAVDRVARRKTVRARGPEAAQGGLPTDCFRD